MITQFRSRLGRALRSNIVVGSQIDVTEPVYGEPTTFAQRDNWRTASREITALQQILADGGEVPGPPGPPGPQGPQGERGFPGLNSEVPGPPGQTGAEGPRGFPGEAGQAATVAVDPSPETGLPGSEVSVVNLGSSSAAVFRFRIPRGAQGLPGPQGDPGSGITVKGRVPSQAQLPTTGNAAGDMWIAEDTGHGWVYTITPPWTDAGPIRGPQGDPGQRGQDGTPGAAGPAGAAATVAVDPGTITLAPGSDASVFNLGTTSAALFRFSIPRGAQGLPGADGAPSTQPGPPGSPGAAATISAGTVTMGTPESAASVTNRGNSAAAIFDFTLPRGFPGTPGADGAKGDTGDRGPPGEDGQPGSGITVMGRVPTAPSGLPTTGNLPGHMWIAEDTGHGWVYTGQGVPPWTDAGPIRGPQGDPGPPGQSITGPAGAAATVSVDTPGTITGDPGTGASVTNTGSTSAAVLRFTIPRGAKGDDGAPGTPGQSIQGPAGDAATITAGSASVGTPLEVTNVGTSSHAIFNFRIPAGQKGDTGDTGPAGGTGPAGTAATIVGVSATPGAAGSQPSVTNVGNNTAANFAFVIPRGDTGAKGDTGDTGPAGQSITGPKGDTGAAGANGLDGATLVTAGWLANNDPNMATVFLNNTGRTLTIVAIHGTVEVPGGGTVNVQVMTGASNGGNANVTAFNAAAAVGSHPLNVQIPSLGNGARLRLATAGDWTDSTSVGSINVYLQ